MSKICEYCEKLDLVSLLEEPASVDSSLADRLVRYYCQNPETDQNYCPYWGDKDKCIYHKMLSFNQAVLK